MGCNQSKTNEVVIEPITAPTSECGKASMDLAFTEIIVDQETSTSVPPPLVEEESSSSEEEEAETLVKEEETIDKEEETVGREEIPVEEEEIKPVVEEEVIPVNEIKPHVEVESVVEEPVIEAEEENVHVEAAVEEEEAPMEPEVEVEEEVGLQDEKSSVVDKSSVTSVNSPVWTFVAGQVAFSVGIAFFNIGGSNSEGEDVHLTKRYSDFKLLHADMSKLMTREELPSMPGTSFLQGRNDKALLEERETTFVEMLNAIAVHPEGSQSAAFNSFLI